jgi:glycine/sarcosine N-methyltransferase
MTNVAARLDAESRVLQPIVRECNIGKAADMGCGTGLHVAALSKLGVEMTGFDISANMLCEAERRAGARGIRARFIRGSFLAPELGDSGPFDAVFCLGNSLPHVASADELSRILQYWRRCLSEHGVIVIQLLNYGKILRTRDRIIGIRKSGSATTVRFYDFTSPMLTFNILTITDEGGRVEHRIQSTQLLPLTREALISAAGDGFAAIEVYGSMNREAFSIDAKDLVVMLRR